MPIERAREQSRKPRRSMFRRITSRLRQVGFTISAALLSLGVLFPFAWMLFTAVKSRRELPRNPLGLPAEWHWENFLEAWKVGHFDRYFMNSVYVAVPTVVAILVLSTLCAYALSMMSFRGKNAIFVTILIGLAIPLDILVIPLFYDLLALDLLNTHWAVILPTAAKILPFGVLLVRSFMDELPEEIMDAGKIDGCSSFQLLRHIVVPLSLPCLTSLLVFAFMWTWNLFILPVVVIQEDSMRTLPQGLNYFQGRYSTNIPLLMAGAAISSVPVVLIYMFFQRQFIRGIMAGALKS
jgi:raffinose/stachyose/melibiose transport system permease protein